MQTYTSYDIILGKKEFSTEFMPAPKAEQIKLYQQIPHTNFQTSQKTVINDIEQPSIR